MPDLFFITVPEAPYRLDVFRADLVSEAADYHADRVVIHALRIVPSGLVYLFFRENAPRLLHHELQDFKLSLREYDNGITFINAALGEIESHVPDCDDIGG